MTANVYVPTLSTDEWVNNSMKTADYLLSWFFLSEYSQTYLYIGEISSLPYILHTTQGDMVQAATLTRETLKKYFSRHFNNVVVEVSEVPNDADPSAGQLKIYLKFTDKEDKEFVLGKMLEISNMTIKRIIDINNG